MGFCGDGNLQGVGKFEVLVEGRHGDVAAILSCETATSKPVRGGSPDPWSIAKVSSVFFIFSVCLLGHRGSARRMDVGPSGAVGDIVSGGFEVTATFATELVRVSEDETRTYLVGFGSH